jgi:hypothetical protein
VIESFIVLFYLSFGQYSEMAGLQGKALERDEGIYTRYRGQLLRMVSREEDGEWLYDLEASL